MNSKHASGGLEGIAYTNNGASLVSVDMATGDILQSISGNAPITGIARDGQFIYTISSDNTFQIIDLNSGLMVLDATLSLPGGGQQLVVGDGVAYVAAGKLLPDNSGTGGYWTVDVTNSHAPHLIEGVDNLLEAGGSIALNGSGIGLTVQFINNGVDVLDTSNASNTGNIEVGRRQRNRSASQSQAALATSPMAMQASRWSITNRMTRWVSRLKCKLHQCPVISTLKHRAFRSMRIFHRYWRQGH